MPDYGGHATDFDSLQRRIPAVVRHNTDIEMFHQSAPTLQFAEAKTKQRSETSWGGSGKETMSDHSGKFGSESTGREVHVQELDLDLIRLSSLGGGEPRNAQYTGTKALMLAILEDGIRSYLSPVGRVRCEAEYWVTSTRQRSPFSFTVVCETLGLEPEAVRTALERLRAKKTHPRKVLGRSRPNVRRTGRIVTRKTG
jgi:hypothetical protein